MAPDERRQIIGAIREEIAQAVDCILDATEASMRAVRAVRSGEGGGLDGLEHSLGLILEACAFQDLTGQRLTKLEAALGAGGTGAVGADPLLDGPALRGQGLDQAAADALLARKTP